MPQIKSKRSILTMYVIQRKEDGLFYKSTTWRTHKDGNWTNDISKCRVFKNTSGAKCSSAWISRKYIPCEKPNLCWTCKERERRFGVPSEGCKQARGAYVKMTEDELPYRVVPVRMQVKQSIQLS